MSKGDNHIPDTKLLVIETPDELRDFILNHRLEIEDDEIEVFLAIIIDNLILLATEIVFSPEKDEHIQIHRIALSTMHEIGLENYEYLEEEVYRLFEKSYKKLLSILIAYDCYNKHLYCTSIDIYKTCIEVREKDVPWR